MIKVYRDMNMADMPERKLKLTNSRKRFRELQELKKKKDASKSKLSAGSENISKNVIPVDSVDSMTSSAHSSTNEQIQQHLSDVIMQLPNYFNQNQAPTVFFDSVSEDFAQTTEGDINTDISEDVFNDVNALPIQNVMQNIIPDTADSSNTKDHEIKLKKYLVQDNYLFPQGTHFLKEMRQLVYPSEDIVKNQPQIICKEICDLHNSSEHLQCEISEDENLAIKKKIPDSKNQVEVGVQHSNIESLLQLSDQMTHLVEPDYCTSGSITDLEKRNLELATLLEQEKIKSERQNSFINNLENKISLLDLRKEDEICNVHVIREKNRLNEDLQYHIQTVGMLVAEKAELSANISKFELTSIQKSSECEELQTLLKVSRLRIAELEKEMNALKCEKMQNDKVMKEQSEIIIKLKQDYSCLKNKKEEVTQEMLEIREKLNKINEENRTLQKQNLEVSSKLSLASIKIQQLTTGEQLQITSHIKKINEEKIELERHLSNLNQVLQSVTKERDESSVQYQQYAQQQNSQLATLSNKIEQLQTENEILSTQEQNRIQHITELERQLQNLQSEEMTFTNNNSSDCILKTDLDNTREICVQLQIEKNNLEENYMKATNEKDMLLKELNAKNDSLLQLESMVERLRGNQPDSMKLLAVIESDKVAAAIAVQQNRDLKQQLESMEEVLLKLNNDKVELTEHLSMEVKNNKELLEKLKRTELHLQRLTDAIEIKDRELSHLKEMYAKLNQDDLQHEQFSNILQQYKTQENYSHILENQLQEAEQTVVKLTNEIHFLRHGINRKDDRNEIIDHANINSVHAELKFQNEESNTHLQNENNNINNYLQNDDDKFGKEIAMKHLEDKFTRTMQDIANLTEERQRLDHLVLQLQGETETIGEYVALYQHQRMIFKQKTFEKDQQLKQFSVDRKQMKFKIEKLNKLVRKLLVERDIAPPVRHLQEFTNETCQDRKSYKELHNAHELCKVKDDILTEQSLNPSEIPNEILMLLSDIQSSNLMQTDENIHHCPWCSGQLMTV